MKKILGIVIIEILRITVFSGKRLRKLYSGISYIVLICLEIGIYFMLRIFVM